MFEFHITQVKISKYIFFKKSYFLLHQSLHAPTGLDKKKIQR